MPYWRMYYKCHNLFKNKRVFCSLTNFIFCLSFDGFTRSCSLSIFIQNSLNFKFKLLKSSMGLHMQTGGNGASTFSSVNWKKTKTERMYYLISTYLLRYYITYAL